MSIVVVTGIPRSGTSMMMRMLEAGGVPCVYEQRSDAFNPAGYYEDPAGMAGDFSAVPPGHAVKCLHMLPAVPGHPDARVIIMRRDYDAALASANRAAAARGRPEAPAESAGFLAGQVDAIRKWCSSRHHIQVLYEDVIRNTPNEVYCVAAFLGLPLDNRLAGMADVVNGRSY